MGSATTRLVQRLTSLVTSTAAFVGGQRSNAQVLAPSELTATNETETHTDSHVGTPQLVYGAARHGAIHLASHASHSSHASHASHYSGSGGGGSPPPPASAPTPSAPPSGQQPAPSTPRAPSKPIPKQENREKLDQVLKKLPNIRSRWPAKVVLKNDTFFNIFDGNKVVGIVSMKTGATLTLIEVKPEHAIVSISASTSPVPVESTDLIERIGGVDAILALPDDSESPAEVEKPEAKKPTPETSPRGKSSKG